MDSRSRTHRSITWLPDEQFELALDAQRGALTQPGEGQDTLTLTTRRAIRVGQRSGRRTTAAVPLDRVTAVEISDVGRPTARLAQGLLIVGASVILAVVIWVVLEVYFFSLLVAGVPALVGIYMLAGYAFPNDMGELTLYAGSYAIRLPLMSEHARHDSYLMAQRLFELLDGASQDSRQEHSSLSGEADVHGGAATPPGQPGDSPGPVRPDPSRLDVVETAWDGTGSRGASPAIPPMNRHARPSLSRIQSRIQPNRKRRDRLHALGNGRGRASHRLRSARPGRQWLGHQVRGTAARGRR